VPQIKIAWPSRPPGIAGGQIGILTKKPPVHTWEHEPEVATA